MNKETDKLINKYPELDVCGKDIENAFTILTESFRKNGKLLLCGNGGSAADCEHIVGELMKGFTLQRPVDAEFRKQLSHVDSLEADYIADNLQQALPAISLASQSALMTAFANDVAADMVYAQQVYGYGNSGDVLIAISTSGNSNNVLKAVKVAKSLGVKTIGLTGESGGRMKDVCDVTICVPYQETLDIQERHLPIYHTLCIMLEKEFFKQ
ncbi:D-sedoheptulose-7-phosphate isomerase [Sediminibacillus massiliensis]|uniref:D-sedoheptulose-7-phosphate isomerase n=1 Tax=Sediminibacillus massiliensis TaxID=1926277 RepID=UPI0015C393F4|nr:SIS domain-containing protein [Sediminibacillus massiliensis]